MKPIFIDIDGTLCDSQGRITLATRSALALAAQNNYEPILCTGRPRDYALNLSRQLQSNYLIYNSGAGIYNCKTDKVLYENSMEVSSILKLYDLVKVSDVNFILEYNGSSYCYSLNKSTQYELLSLEALRKILNNNHIQQIVIDSKDFTFMRSLRNKINQIPKIKTSNQSKCLIDPSLPSEFPVFFYDVVDIDTSKGNGIKKFCELLHISSKDCIAIGDDENDISMFRNCGQSVAMGNALPEVKAAANFVTLDNDHDGIAFFIEKLLF